MIATGGEIRAVTTEDIYLIDEAGNIKKQMHGNKKINIVLIQIIPRSAYVNAIHLT